MGSKKVKITIGTKGTEGSVHVDPWDVAVLKSGKDEIEWTSDRDFTIEYKTPGHFDGPTNPVASGPSMLGANKVVKSGPVRENAPEDKFAYTIKTTGPTGDDLTVDPGYRVYP